MGMPMFAQGPTSDAGIEWRELRIHCTVNSALGVEEWSQMSAVVAFVIHCPKQCWRSRIPNPSSSAGGQLQVLPYLAVLHFPRTNRRVWQCRSCHRTFLIDRMKDFKKLFPVKLRPKGLIVEVEDLRIDGAFGQAGIRTTAELLDQPSVVFAMESWMTRGTPAQWSVHPVNEITVATVRNTLDDTQAVDPDETQDKVIAVSGEEAADPSPHRMNAHSNQHVIEPPTDVYFQPIETVWKSRPRNIFGKKKPTPFGLRDQLALLQRQHAIEQWFERHQAIRNEWDIVLSIDICPKPLKGWYTV